jgi:23S rRNA (cytosine1962-C5)-methyltransferase
MGSLVVQPRSRLFHGHEWVYGTEVKARSGEPQPGDVVTLKDVRGRPLGSAIYNPKSQIIARRFSFRRQDLDAEFFQRRIERAWKLRQTMGIDTNLCRVVWSESDGLPGLIVDRYGDHVVMQTLTLAMDQRTDLIRDALLSVLQCKSIIARNEVAVRKAEGMECLKEVLAGEQPAPFALSTGGMTFQVDVWEGQKTGLYLDQIDNYAAVARLAKGRRVMDCFCNQGGFAQAAALAGASEVVGVDASASALASAAINAEAAGLRVRWQEGNVFDVLKESETKGETQDLIVLDPPSFTKTKQSVNDALRGYKEIHLRAMKMLEPGGVLATFSCSHHISTGEFYSMIGDAAVDAKRKLRLIDSYHQRRDHPIILGMPETEYLRGYAFEVVGGW